MFFIFPQKICDIYLLYNLTANKSKQNYALPEKSPTKKWVCCYGYFV